MNSEKIKFVLGLGLMLFAGYLYLSMKDQQDINEEEIYLTTVQEAEVVENVNQVKDVYAELPQGKVELAKKIESDESELEKSLQESRAQQEALRNEFLQEIHAEVNLPDNLKYTELDLEEGIGGIYGVDGSGKNEFAMIGSEKKATVEQIVDYLNTSQGALPHVRNGDFSTKPVVKKIPAPSGKGISSIQVIQGKKSNDRMLYAAVIERSDKKGIYVFVMKAPTSFFETNEGFLDSMLDSLQVK